MVSEAAWYCCVYWLSWCQHYCRQSASSIFPVSALYCKKEHYVLLIHHSFISCATLSEVTLTPCGLISPWICVAATFSIHVRSILACCNCKLFYILEKKSLAHGQNIVFFNMLHLSRKLNRTFYNTENDLC